MAIGDYMDTLFETKLEIELPAEIHKKSLSPQRVKEGMRDLLEDCDAVKNASKNRINR